MSQISTTYNPKQVEPKWRQKWLQAKAFAGKVDPLKKPFCIMIPPPNVTGTLHMGHILNNTIQDVLIRRARLEQKAALWYPGTDHAGIATQIRVEKKLQEEGKTKHDLGRKQFIEKVWEWREKHGNIILKQLQELGASCDWDRTTFTLDKQYSTAVLTAFVKLYHRGYIYRGKRMVNWCPVSQTALSDEEVIPTPQKSTLYNIRYELLGQHNIYLEISTTRPETIMGDTAVAVHPKDQRYKHLIGQKVWRPFPRAPIPIIADEHVDQEFGTGVLKVTPAHDPADFQISQRHNLPIIDILNPDATLSQQAGHPFIGMDRFEARRAVLKKLKENNLLISEQPYENNIGYSERAKVPIEPRLSEQWFLKYPKVDEAKAVINKGLIKFHPKRWEKTYLHWLDNIQDWCISRQLWWGHRIPVWYKKGQDRQDPTNWHVSVNGPKDPENWEQDSDVLDTWASSWLWPFANFGWPQPPSPHQQQQELDYFYPTSVLCTGFDIIFFWVARMIIAGLELIEDQPHTNTQNKPLPLTKEQMRKRIPFKHVYITGLIRDNQGRKMSKSLGNSPNPLDLIEKFGADGLRFGILNIAPSGQDILFSEDRIQIGRNFCNKLWNACRFRQTNAALQDNSSLEIILSRIEPEKLDAYDHWILSRLIQTQQTIDHAFKKFEIHQMTHTLHNFFWGDFCDWYIEASKSKLQSKTHQQNTCLALQDLIIRQSLLIFHPIMPHITEELWQQLGYNTPGRLFIHEITIGTAQEFKQALENKKMIPNPQFVEQVQAIKIFISEARALKAQYNVATKRDLRFFLTTKDNQQTLINNNQQIIQRLAGAREIVFCDKPQDAPARVTPLGTLYLDTTSTINIEAEKVRLNKELEKLNNAIQAGEKKLQNEKFLNNAPKNIVEGAQTLLTQTKAKKEEILRLLTQMKSLEKREKV
jgi:valyl-tRNA synthetase